MSDSFPFFAIAQHFGVPYAEVLEVAGLIEIGLFDPLIDRELYCHVENAVCCERQRRIEMGPQPWWHNK